MYIKKNLIMSSFLLTNSVFFLYFVMKKLGIIINPEAGRKKAKDYFSIVKDILEKNFICEYSFTTEEGKGYQSAKELLNKKVDGIVIVGGNGTAVESAEIIIENDIPILPLPLGKGSDYPRSIYGKMGVIDMLEKLNRWNIKYLDAGIVKIDRKKYYFLNGFGIGYDVEVIKNMRRSLNTYFVSVGISYFSYQPKWITLIEKNFIFKGSIYLLTVGIGKYMGGGFNLLPDAVMDDGILDISVIEYTTFFNFIGSLGKVYKGTHTNLNIVHYRKVKSVIVKSKKPVLSHIDGEILPPSRHIEISIVPKAVPVFY